MKTQKFIDKLQKVNEEISKTIAANAPMISVLEKKSAILNEAFSYVKTQNITIQQQLECSLSLAETNQIEINKKELNEFVTFLQKEAESLKQVIAKEMKKYGVSWNNKTGSL